MQNLKQFFSYMNDIDFPYVVLRNWEKLPYSAITDKHSDLDLLVFDYKQFTEIFPKAMPVYPWPRVQHKMKIGDEIVFIDVRSVGDGYYPTHFAFNILETREFNPKGFYTPNPSHFRIALAYHCVHHKNANTYPQHLGDAKVSDMLESLKKSKVGYTIPDDISVGRYNQYWKGATSVVERDGDKVVKEQISYDTYDLIENEYRILSEVKSIHFPKVNRLDDNKISIDDCGSPMTVKNYPQNWKEQLVEIMSDLKHFNIQHRDIKPDNLMVRNGIIKLIDFGWARLYSDPPDSPPKCLGYPYKPTEGWNDHFSMRKVIKEFEYKIKELQCVS